MRDLETELRGPAFLAARRAARAAFEQYQTADGRGQARRSDSNISWSAGGYIPLDHTDEAGVHWTRIARAEEVEGVWQAGFGCQWLYLATKHRYKPQSWHRVELIEPKQFSRADERRLGNYI